jgi:hypothetical protein
VEKQQAKEIKLMEVNNKISGLQLLIPLAQQQNRPDKLKLYTDELERLIFGKVDEGDIN